MLMHPVGRSSEQEEACAATIINVVKMHKLPALLLEPNLDPGRDGILRAINASGMMSRAHVHRAHFVGLLRRVAQAGGCLVGNSSAGLIECAALRVPVVDIGPRQAGREAGANVIHVAREDAELVGTAIKRACGMNLATFVHPYGDGKCGDRIAATIAQLGLPTPRMLRKRCAY
jgi:hypothetical protein